MPGTVLLGRKKYLKPYLDRNVLLVCSWFQYPRNKKVEKMTFYAIREWTYEGGTDEGNVERGFSVSRKTLDPGKLCECRDTRKNSITRY
jgi:hypothetical protein